MALGSRLPQSHGITPAHRDPRSNNKEMLREMMLKAFVEHDLPAIKED
jgi:hypothetical protein